MRKSITQKDEMGCGVACLAFNLNCSYNKALQLLKGDRKKAKNYGFFCKDIVAGLHRSGENYQFKYIKTKIRNQIYQNQTIVFIKRSKKYPVGHYLCRYENLWMDPWINLPKDKNIKNAKSGFRKRLPGHPIYMIQFIP
ncbi:MAG: cysteine peptidase family C39 domain-containing protein [bacterium]|nr:cysteine peptidase family C39 domain-containing protein [bacterium]